MIDGQLDLLDTPPARPVVPTRDVTLLGPTARRTDPPTARHAAARVVPAAGELERAVRAYVAVHGPSTAWEIAEGVCAAVPGRWEHATVRSACAPARSGLVELSGGWRKGRPVVRYALASASSAAARVGDTPQ